MDFVKDLAAGGVLLTAQLAGTFSDVLGILPIPHTPQAWGECFAWFLLYVLARWRDRRRLRARVKRVKAALPPRADEKPVNA